MSIFILNQKYPYLLPLVFHGTAWNQDSTPIFLLKSYFTDSDRSLIKINGFSFLLHQAPLFFCFDFPYSIAVLRPTVGGALELKTPPGRVT